MMTIHSAADLGPVLRSARKRLGLTQSELALAAGCGVRFIVEAENGKPTLRLDTLLRVIHALGGVVSVSGLLADNEDGDHDT